MPLLDYTHRIISRESLSSEDARAAMAIILRGEANVAQVASFLVALRMKGETAEELQGLAEAMRDSMIRVDTQVRNEPLLDTCGTGGDGHGTLNVSTLAALVVAGAGVKVAKHGNRAVSSSFGSGDLLEALGARLDLTPEQLGRAVREIGFAFLFAPSHHPAMRHAGPARAELKMRTVFNLLGPLANPAGASHQLIGAPSVEAAELMANALACLGSERAFVVHGEDGLDEVTTTGATAVFEVGQNSVNRFEWRPSDFGVAPARASDLEGGDRTRNCEIAMSVLTGERGARRDIVLVNAAAALVAAGAAADTRAGMLRAAESIDSGAARLKLKALAEFSG